VLPAIARCVYAAKPCENSTPPDLCPAFGKMSDLKRNLKDLLMREAHLRLWRDQLKPKWAEKEAELRAVQTAKPMLLPIVSRRRREEYESRLNAAQAAVTHLRERLDMLERCEPHIKKMIEEEIEIILREQCPEYIEALAALRQKEDWCRCLDRFGQKIFEFTRALGNVRNHASAGYLRDTQKYSAGTEQGFGHAIEAAQKVEEEVKFANRISETQAQIFLKNGIQTKPLPRLHATRYLEWVQRIRALPLVEAQTQFGLLIEETKKLHATGIEELRGQADSVNSAQLLDIRNFLMTAWDQYRAEIAPEVFPGDTANWVADTELMVSHRARNSVVGRL